jgi:monoterpene epsilon-lactone hydrolase
MPSPQHETIVAALAAQLANPPPTPPTLEETRAGFVAMTAGFAVPGDVRVERASAGGVPAAWISAPGARDDAALLYLHGGGYMLGSIQTHTELCSRIARATGLRALAIDYRLAPEHPYPAAVEDAVAAWRWLRGQGLDASRIAIAGDSAGGGLTLATLVALRERGEALPACAVCLSPFTDLTGTGPDDANDDPLLTREAVKMMADTYLQGTDATQPTASPVRADFRGFPPLLLQVGTRERLLPDSTRVAERARAAGVDVSLEKGEGLIHVWHLFGPEMPESRDAVAAIGAFVRKHLA